MAQHGLLSSFDAIREGQPGALRGRARTPTMLSPCTLSDDDLSPPALLQHKQQSRSPVVVGTLRHPDGIIVNESRSSDISEHDASSSRAAVIGDSERQRLRRGRSEEPRVLAIKSASNNTVATSCTPIAPKEKRPEHSRVLSRRANNKQHNG